jgi:hypothetical protein
MHRGQVSTKLGSVIQESGVHSIDTSDHLVWPGSEGLRDIILPARSALDKFVV